MQYGFCKKICRYITDINYRISVNGDLGFYNIISDRMFLKLMYYIKMHQVLDLSYPKTFNEKLQWLKLYDRKPIYTTMVDKYEVKKYVASKIGEKYIIPTLGVWECFDDIDFDNLPNQFVLKCTHDSGGLVICKDKSNFDKISAKKRIDRCLKRNYYWSGREWPYKNVKPRIIAEKFMSNNVGELADYKIHNFNGVPKVVLVCRDRFKESGLTEDFFDCEWKHLDISRTDYPNSHENIPKPVQLDEMLELSKKLSESIPFVRTDFYDVGGKVYFGEMTFYPASGFERFVPDEYDDLFGEWIKIPIGGGVLIKQ